MVSFSAGVVNWIPVVRKDCRKRPQGLPKRRSVRPEADLEYHAWQRLGSEGVRPGVYLKKNVAGCELHGVRACWALISRAGLLPIRLLTIRTPWAAGD